MMPKILVLAAMLWYCVAAILLIAAKPGFHYDEAIDVMGAVHLQHSHADLTIAHEPHTWFCIKEHCFPLMSARYIGSVKEYLCVPLFALFGPRAEVVRLLAMAMGALGILGIATLIGAHFSYPAAAAVAWTLAVHPSYVGMTVLDNSAFAPWMLAVGLMCFAISAYITRASVKTAFWLGMTLGFGVWARANFVWLLGALFLAFAFSAGRRMLLPLRHWIAMALGGIIGGLPFLVYQALSGGGTWAAVDLFPDSGTWIERLQHRLAMLAETMVSDGEHRVIWNGPALPVWELWLFPALVLIACVVCVALKQRRGFLPRISALTLLFFTAIFLYSDITVAEHHMITLLPLAAVTVVLAASEMLRHKSLMIGIALVYASCALYWQYAAVRGIQLTGGVGVWSDGIYALTKEVTADYPGSELKILDWGLQDNLYVLSDARVKPHEIFWEATVEHSDWNRPWIEEIRRGGLYLLMGERNRDFPPVANGFLRALAEGRPSVHRTVISQRSRIPYAEIIDVVPNSLGAAPVAVSRREILADDPLFEKSASGFQKLEGGGWRWTKRLFSLDSAGASTFTIRLTIPEASISKLGTITMRIRAGGSELAPELFSHAGDYTVARSLPAGVSRIEFSLDKVIGPTASDGRELGIIFVSARF